MDINSVDISSYSKENCTYFIRDERVFLIDRIKDDPTTGKLIGIGGRNESGESTQDAAIREIIQETNLTINDFISEDVRLQRIGLLVMHSYMRSIDIWIAESKIDPVLYDDSGQGRFYHKSIVDTHRNKFMPGDLIFWPYLFSKENFRVDVINDQVYLNNRLIEYG